MSRQHAARRFIAILDAQPRCERCGRVIYRTENHCPKCGKKNDAFVHDEFVAFRRTTLERALKRCARKHPKDIAALSQHETKWLEFPFCEDCGAFFLRYLAH